MMMEVDAMLEEEATSEVEESYSVGEDDDKKDRGAERDSLPFQIAKDINEGLKEEEEKTES